MGQRLDENDHKIRLKVLYSGDVLVTSIEADISYEGLLAEMKDICKFEEGQPFTIKWVDEEGDPCTISSPVELEEAFRLFDINKDTEILVHVFPNVPVGPGQPCAGEDRNMYRRGARRWRKLYRVNGHLFQPKRFNRRAFCAYCSDRIWGLGRQGFKCVDCKLHVHKKCHKRIKLTCGTIGDPNVTSSTSYSSHDNGDSSTRSSGKFDSSAGLYGTSGISYNDKQPSSQIHAAGGGALAIGIEDFTLIRVIGRGSYAKVFAVEQKRTKRKYAMKVVKKELVNDDEDIDWVQTEKHVFEVASNHPFLVGLHSCFQSTSRLFFVIELVNGGDLMFHMQRQRRLPEEHARFYSAEITLALSFLHDKGIIYRDLKLDNVLLDSDGHVKLTDYGMCKEGVMPGDKASTFCGTPSYIAPEMLRGEDYGTIGRQWSQMQQQKQQYFCLGPAGYAFVFTSVCFFIRSF